MRYSVVITVIFFVLPVVLGSDHCLLKSSFQINNRITTECKVPANATAVEDVETLSALCESDTHELQILKARETEFGSRGICHKNALKTAGMYMWITWRDFQLILRPLVSDLSEENAFVGRDGAGNICRVNLTTAACLSNEESDSTNDVTEILLERLPVSYELTDIVYDRWRNVTFLEQIVLTSVNLTNSHLTTDFVESLVRFDYEKKINVTLLSELAFGVPIVLHEDTGAIKYTVGEVTKKIEAGIVSVVKRLPAKTSAIVRVIGTETLSVINMSAKLTTIYARDEYGVDKVEQGDIHTKCIETGVMDVRPEETVSIHIDPPGIGGGPQIQQESTTVPAWAPDLPLTTADPPIALFRSETVYPGLKTYSTIAGIIFFSTCLIAFTDVTRKIIQDRRRKNRKVRNY